MKCNFIVVKNELVTLLIDFENYKIKKNEVVNKSCFIVNRDKRENFVNKVVDRKTVFVQNIEIFNVASDVTCKIDVNKTNNFIEIIDKKKTTKKKRKKRKKQFDWCKKRKKKRKRRKRRKKRKKQFDCNIKFFFRLFCMFRTHMLV